MRHLKSSSGFTLIEILIAIAILSIALLSMASTTISVIRGNLVSNRVTEATSKAQDTIEFLRSKNYSFGTDMTPDSISGGADDSSDNELLNSNTDNDASTAAAALFASPDHAYAINADGSETTNLQSPPPDPLTASASYLRRGWTIKDNTPMSGMKTVTVVVGWVEGGLNRYVSISTVIAGTRYSGEPGTI